MIFKRMREQILDKAIRGQLVPQLQEEGVVEQIGSAPSEVPFDIPSSWKWVQMYSIGKTSTGTTPPTSNSDYYGHDIPFVKPGDIVKNSITYRTNGLSNKSRDVARILPKDSVLMVCIGGSIGKTAMCDREISFNQQINAIICNINYLHPKYMLYAFMSVYFQDEVWRAATGTTTPILKKSRWENLWIPLPPLAEQRRIASKIESLFGEIDCAEKAYEELQSLANVLKGQILQKAIQGKLVPQLPEDGVVEQIGEAPTELPFEIPHTWTSCILSDVAELITDGSHNPPPNTGSGIPVLSAKDLSNGFLTADKASRWTDEEHWTSEFKRCPVQMDDIVLCIVGSIGKVGRVKVETKAILQRSIALIRVKESIITKDFFELFLNSLFCQKWLVKGSAGTAQKGIYLKSLRNLPVVIPPLAEQKRIVAKVNALFEQIDLMIK